MNFKTLTIAAKFAVNGGMVIINEGFATEEIKVGELAIYVNGGSMTWWYLKDDE